MPDHIFNKHEITTIEQNESEQNDMMHDDTLMNMEKLRKQMSNKNIRDKNTYNYVSQRFQKEREEFRDLEDLEFEPKVQMTERERKNSPSLSYVESSVENTNRRRDTEN